MSDRLAISQQTLVDHVCRRIERGTMRAEPFPHLVVDGVLPEDTFQRLIADLPPVEEFVPMARTGWTSVSRYEHHGTSTLYELSGRSDPDIWVSVRHALTDLQVEANLRGSVAPGEDATRHLPLRKEVRLDCARAGAYLLAHTDAPILFMKTLIYLRCGEPDPSADTLLYVPKDPDARLARLGALGDYTDDNYGHEAADDHHEAGRVPFRPNRLLCFRRCRDSLHGLAPLSSAAAPRYLISTHFKHIRD